MQGDLTKRELITFSPLLPHFWQPTPSPSILYFHLHTNQTLVSYLFLLSFFNLSTCFLTKQLLYKQKLPPLSPINSVKLGARRELVISLGF